jgi:hemerythrin
MPDFIVWNLKYTVYVKALDEEHKRIIGVINRMYIARNRANLREILEDALDQLTDYAMTHFAHEEQLMAKYRYPDWKKHRLEHRVFVKKMSVLKMNLLVNEIKIHEELFEFLKKWWQHHIQIEDKKYGPFFNLRGLE